MAITRKSVKIAGITVTLPCSDNTLSLKGMTTFEVAIDEFWRRVEARENRMSLLLEFASRVVLTRRSYQEMRRGGLGIAKTTQGTTCFACYQGKASHRHHVIWVVNGGRNTRRNLVPICGHCHARVHPWMKA